MAEVKRNQLPLHGTTQDTHTHTHTRGEVRSSKVTLSIRGALFYLSEFTIASRMEAPT